MPALRLCTALVVAIVASCGPPTGTPPGSAMDGAAATGQPAPTEARQPPSPRPPSAILVGGDGGPVEGALGSWAFEGSGSDSPWIPAQALHEGSAGAGAHLEVGLASGEPIGSWAARIAAADDPTAEFPLGLGGRDDPEPQTGRVSLDPLPTGRWVLSVRLALADGRGDATFYWLISAG